MTEVAAPEQRRRRTNRVPRSRGAVSGVLLILLGLWGGLVPFVGPYFDYSYGSDKTWDWTTGRGWLEVLPGAVAVVGGLLLLTSKNRIRGSLGGWLAAAAGAWFVIGKTVSTWWRTGGVGEPVSQHVSGRAVADLGYFYGLGAVMVFLAAFALGRLAVVGVRDIAAAERDDALAAEAAAREQEIARQREEQWEQARQAEAERLETERAQAQRNQEAAEERAAQDRTSPATPAGNTAEERVGGTEPTVTESPRRDTSADRPTADLDGPSYDRTSRRAADDGPSYDGQSDYNQRRSAERGASGYDAQQSDDHRPAHVDRADDQR